MLTIALMVVSRIAFSCALPAAEESGTLWSIDGLCEQVRMESLRTNQQVERQHGIHGSNLRYVPQSHYW